ncbi:MAG: DUF1819 family protein [Spirochaetia bacterium]|nr:DUF1819 family protein [Spirochaetia bacterium]
MAILQLIAEEEKSLCFDFLEEKIREESRKLIESIYADEVNQFLEKMASIGVIIKSCGLPKKAYK